jgi:twitching motility protein PilT
MDHATLIERAVEQGASDLHLQAGAAPIFRVAGSMRQESESPLSQEQMLGMLQAIAPSHRRSKIPDEAAHGMDFSYIHSPTVRFRCSVYSAMTRLGVTMRVIKTRIPTVDELHLPRVVVDIAMSQRGLTLVTGTTGSGKSTTLAAMIDLINTNCPAKIITIEDPIEYIHTNKQALISQMEVGTDTPSFEQALRQALRQDPDVILVGELRDVDTLKMALRAADTGHQVFATVHSARAAQTVERIIAMFPPAEHKLLLSQLGHSVEAILSQRLLTCRDEKSRRPAIEILRGGPITERYILENRIADLSGYLESGESGMQSFDQHLLQLYNEKVIAGKEALRHANKPEALATAMRGIKFVGRTGG